MSSDGQLPKLKSSSKVPDTHSVGAICNYNVGVFTVTEVAMENADTVPPAHPVPRTPKLAYPGLRRCGGPSVPLTFLARLAAWQSLCTRHVDASLETHHRPVDAAALQSRSGSAMVRRRCRGVRPDQPLPLQSHARCRDKALLCYRFHRFPR
jgi:hypothetical protein